MRSKGLAKFVPCDLPRRIDECDPNASPLLIEHINNHRVCNAWQFEQRALHAFRLYEFTTRLERKPDAPFDMQATICIHATTIASRKSFGAPFDAHDAIAEVAVKHAFAAQMNLTACRDRNLHPSEWLASVRGLPMRLRASRRGLRTTLGHAITHDERYAMLEGTRAQRRRARSTSNEQRTQRRKPTNGLDFLCALGVSEQAIELGWDERAMRDHRIAMQCIDDLIRAAIDAHGSSTNDMRPQERPEPTHMMQRERHEPCVGRSKRRSCIGIPRIGKQRASGKSRQPWLSSSSAAGGEEATRSLRECVKIDFRNGRAWLDCREAMFQPRTMFNALRTRRRAIRREHGDTLSLPPQRQNGFEDALIGMRDHTDDAPRSIHCNAPIKA